MPLTAESNSLVASDASQAVAIIGMHGIYPGAADLDAFWDNLRTGRDCIREIPADRWPIEGFYSPDINSITTSYSKWGGFIDKMDYFDPLFFKIQPKEAEFLDPQERLFIESAWCAVENAGYTPRDLCGKDRRVGVYVGVMWGHYQLFAAEELQRGNIAATSSAFWSIANRVSFIMDFNGPSMAIDTACSSSLTAIHLAFNSVRSGESELAIAGGVNLSLHPLKYYLLSGRRFASTDGRCRAFGEGGSGYVPGEGVGAILLKKLSRAIEDNDHIYGVIRGTSINHGGKAGGYTVPNSYAQGEVVRQAMENAGVTAKDINYIEAHGTGTSLGDPIEISGLVTAFDDKKMELPECPIGSVKSNIGHLESAAGIASVHKVLLQMKHKLIAPSIHSEPVNPYINFAASPFKVQRQLGEWKPSPRSGRRVAGISSFGAGGSNAHIIVEEYIRPEPAPFVQPLAEVIILLSAQDEPTLHRYARDMAHHLEKGFDTSFSLTDFAYTLQVGRTPQTFRLAFLSRSLQETAGKLAGFLDRHAMTFFYHKADKRHSHPAPEEIDDLMHEGRLAEICEAWSMGCHIDWNRYYKDRRPRRMPLPNYPFNKRKLWYQPLNHLSALSAKVTDAPNPPEPPKPVELPKVAKTPDVIEPAKAPDDIAVHYLAPFLKDNEIPANTSARSSHLIFLSDNPDEFNALKNYYPPGAVSVVSGNYEDLAATVAATEIDLLLNITEFTSDIDQNNDWLQTDTLLSRAFTNVRQALLAFKGKKVNILAWYQSDDPKLLPALRSLASLGGVASHEFPNAAFRILEFQDDAGLREKAMRIIMELNSPSDPGLEVVYTERGRMEYEIGRVGSLHTEQERPPLIKQEGVYLITGGSGAIGAAIARYLLANKAAAVVLTGRKALNDLPPGHLALLKSAGGRVSYLSADICDYTRVRELIENVIFLHKKINGVVHAAGIIDDKLIVRKSIESFKSVLMPKILGALHLERATAAMPPDFILYCSSVSALARPIGQIDYATANRFLDEYAGYRNGHSTTRHLSINWPYWNEGGMRIARPYLEVMQKNGIWGISDMEAEEALEAALGQPYPSFIVVKGSEEGLKKMFTGIQLRLHETVAPPAPAKAAVSSISAKAAPPSRRDYTAFLDALRKIIVRSICEGSGLAEHEISTSTDFEEYGFDSVLIMKVTAELEKMIPQLSISLFFECKTIDDVVRKIGAELEAGNLTPSDDAPALPDAPPVFPDIPRALPDAPPETPRQEPSPRELGIFLKDKIVSIISEMSGLSVAEIDTGANMEDYGLDSIVIMKVTSELEKHISGLSISLFFECTTIDAVIDKIVVELQAGTLAQVRESTSFSEPSPALDPAPTRIAAPTHPAASIARKTSFDCFSIKSIDTEGNATITHLELDGRSPIISDHKINGQTLLAGAVFFHLIREIEGGPGLPEINYFRNVSWLAPVRCRASRTPLELSLSRKGKGRQFTISADIGDCATGEFGNESIPGGAAPIPIKAIKVRCGTMLSKNELYAWYKRSQFDYGPAYQVIDLLYIGDMEVLGVLNNPPSTGNSAFSPLLLDGAFQCVGGIMNGSDIHEIWVPFFIEKIQFHPGAVSPKIYVHITKDKNVKDASLQQFDIALLDAAGQVLVQIEHFTLKAYRKPGSTDNPRARENEPIAVVSAVCRFPGAGSPEEFWEILSKGKNVIKEVPADRWDYRQTFDPEKGKKDKSYSKWGGFIDQIDAFDGEFFKIKDSDSLTLDPQQRILLELTQHLFDRAGYSRDELSGMDVAVIVGGAAGRWGDFLGDVPDECRRSMVVNTIQNMLAARISDYYDLRATALTIDTACSSSLVAIHEACQKIRNKEATMAIAGGITLLISEHGHVGFSQAQVLSRDGRSYVFDRRADGMVLGEGAGLVLLKSYRDAIRDGDQVLGVIRGSAVNNDGKTMGITTPNMNMQKDVIAKALANAAIDKRSVTYLETHGTGTLLGDPIEIKAAKEVYGEGSAMKQYCAVASVKSNIGHTLHASGVASFIKVLLALQHKMIPPTLNCETPHPRFEFEKSPFFPALSLLDWKTEGDNPRRAAISSFGFGGTNCHMILEEMKPEYLSLRRPLPLTRFHRKRFWPGRSIEFVDIAVAPTPTSPKISRLTSEAIIEQLESGAISLDEALELEKTLIN